MRLLWETVGSAIEGSTPTPLRCSFDPLRRIFSEAPVKSFPPAQIRNVALVGHGGAGKTTLTEALLFCAGAIARQGRVEDGTTTTDFDPEEVKRGLSLSVALAPFEHEGHKLNVLDTPGYADFVGDVHAAPRVAGLAALVVSPREGWRLQPEAAWRLAPRLAG